MSVRDARTDDRPVHHDADSVRSAEISSRARMNSPSSDPFVHDFSDVELYFDDYSRDDVVQPVGLEPSWQLTHDVGSTMSAEGEGLQRTRHHSRHRGSLPWVQSHPVIPHAITPPNCRLPKEIPPLVPGIYTPLERQIFHHYVNVASKNLTLNASEGKNPFTTLLIPIALADTGLLRLLLGFAASHLGRMQEVNGLSDAHAENRQIQEIKWKYYGDAMQLCSRRIAPMTSPAPDTAGNVNTERTTTSEKDLDIAFAMTMFMCQFDTCESGREGVWRMHLNAAREMVRLRYRNKEDDTPHNRSVSDQIDVQSEVVLVEPILSSRAEEGKSDHNCILDSHVSQFLLDWFFYHDVLASFTLQDEPPMLDIHTRSKKVSKPSSGRRDYLVEYFTSYPATEIFLIGPHDGLLTIIARIINLHQLQEQEEGAVAELERCAPKESQITTTNAVNAEILATALDIYEDLRTWSFSYATVQQEIIGQCYRWSAFILLHSLIYTVPSDQSNGILTTARNELAHNLTRISPTDNAQTCSLFPVFVLGVTAREEAYRDVCRNALNNYYAWCALGNVLEVLEFLEDWWRSNPPSPPVATSPPDTPTTHNGDNGRSTGDVSGLNEDYGTSWWAWKKKLQRDKKCLVLV